VIHAKHVTDLMHQNGEQVDPAEGIAASIGK
jgi:hypothetical protein